MKSLEVQYLAAANFARGLSPCSTQKVLLYSEKRVLDPSLYHGGALRLLDEQNMGRRKIFITTVGPMWEVYLEAAQHLLSHFSSPFVGVKFLYDYGLRPANEGPVRIQYTVNVWFPSMYSRD
jgi:hypothetical protein